MKKTVLVFWLLVRLSACRKIIWEAYFCPALTDKDVGLLNEWIGQSKILQRRLLRLVFLRQIPTEILGAVDRFCCLIEVDLKRAISP